MSRGTCQPDATYGSSLSLRRKRLRPSMRAHDCHHDNSTKWSQCDGPYRLNQLSPLKNLKIAIGSDHGGFELKNQLLGFLRDKVMSVVDCGTHSKDAVDYPRIAYTVGRLVASGQAERGIMIDGAGIGSAMAINKVRARALRLVTMSPWPRTVASTTTPTS